MFLYLTVFIYQPLMLHVILLLQAQWLRASLEPKNGVLHPLVVAGMGRREREEGEGGRGRGGLERGRGIEGEVERG